MKGEIMILYLAGPLFTKAELDWNVALAAAFRRMGYDVLLPQEFATNTGVFNAKAIWEQDVSAIDSADFVIANCNGKDVDSGTAWEMGYAYARGVPVISYRADLRAAGDGTGINLMLSESSVFIKLDFKAAADQVAAVIAAKIK